MTDLDAIRQRVEECVKVTKEADGQFWLRVFNRNYCYAHNEGGVIEAAQEWIDQLTFLLTAALEECQGEVARAQKNERDMHAALGYVDAKLIATATQNTALAQRCQELEAANISKDSRLQERHNLLVMRQEEIARLTAEVAELQREIRQRVWLNHGSHLNHGLYGDDGEMQCSQCGLDFKVIPFEQIPELEMRSAIKSLTTVKQQAQTIDQLEADLARAQERVGELEVCRDHWKTSYEELKAGTKGAS